MSRSREAKSSLQRAANGSSRSAGRKGKPRTMARRSSQARGAKEEEPQSGMATMAGGVANNAKETVRNASARLTKAAKQLVMWGKSHPVKAAAATAALTTLSALLYAAHGSSSRSSRSMA